MVITDELKARLRKYLHEIIPVGGSDTDTNFTDSEIEELLQEAERGIHKGNHRPGMFHTEQGSVHIKDRVRPSNRNV